MGQRKPLVLRFGPQQEGHGDEGSQETGVDVGQLVPPLAAGGALVEVGLDLDPLPLGQLSPHVRAQAIDGVAAGGPGFGAQVGLEVSLS
jgi:hypothetical protein